MESGDRSGPSSRPLSEVYTPQDHLSLKSKGDYSQDDPEEEREDGLQETFAPARDEEEGFHQHGGHHDEKHGNNIVDWDGPNDPENPQNWSSGRKWWITLNTALLTFVVSFGSSIFSATTTVLAERFAVSQEVMILGVTLYVCGFASGKIRDEGILLCPTDTDARSSCLGSAQ